MESSSTTTVTYKLDDAEQFTLDTISVDAGAPVVIHVLYIDATAHNGLAPSKVVVSGDKVRKDGVVSKVWTERKLSVSDDLDELKQFPAAILEGIGLAHLV